MGRSKVDRQTDLFSNTTPTPRRVAEIKRDIGIERAGDHADREHEAWRDSAARLINAYACTHGDFLVEDAAEYAYARSLPLPPDGRAWGAAVRLAKSRGYIVACGYRAAKSSNLSPKVLWRRA
jgi:hypothetical protein